MELWFTEKHTPNAQFSIKVDRQIYTGHSEFQRIDIFASQEFGRFLVLDGYMMLTEKDEFIYHEMIVHVPMCVKPDCKTVLVVGGGDGGTVRELLRYPSVEHVDLVEIDEMVVRACREHLVQTAGCLGDERVSIHYEDGLKFVRHCEDQYDLIIVDSTDPFGPGEGLFTKEFYGNCYKALHEDGIMVNQHESPTRRMPTPCSVPISASWSPFPSAASTSSTFQPIRRGIGSSDLLPRNGIPWRMWTGRRGRPWALGRGTTIRSCMRGHSPCRAMWRKCSGRWNEEWWNET